MPARKPAKKPVKTSGIKIGKVTLDTYVERVANHVWRGNFEDAYFELVTLPRAEAVLVTVHVTALTRDSLQFESFLKTVERLARSGG